MEPGVVRLESTVEFIQRDLAEIKLDLKDLKVEIRDVEKTSLTHFHIMFGALISGSLGLAALMAKAFSGFER